MTRWISLAFVKLLALVAQVLAFLSRTSKLGSGTALPGILVEKFFPFVLPLLVDNFEEIIFVSGTNGKTTTRALLVKIYEEYGKRVCTNTGGANLLRGVASSLLLNQNLYPQANVAILEIEEATLPRISKYIRPHKLVLTNVFRDQLDAYGEIDKTLSYFRAAIDNIQNYKPRFKKRKPTTINWFVSETQETENLYTTKTSKVWLLSNFLKKLKFRQSTNSQISLEENKESQFKEIEECKIYVNKDDKKLLTCLQDCRLPIIGFELDLDAKQKPPFEKTEIIPNLHFQEVYTGRNVVLRNTLSRFLIKVENQEIAVQTKLPGVYNLYNVLASFAVCYEKLSEHLLRAISDFEPVFGRGETINLDDSLLHLFLIKNPAGFQQVLSFLQISQTQKQIQIYTPSKKEKLDLNLAFSEKKLLEYKKDREESQENEIAFKQKNSSNSKENSNRLHLLILINDNIADGRDVSWLWDVDIESVFSDLNIEKIVVGGTRGLDMLLRLYYAQCPVSLDDYYQDFQQIIQLIKESQTKEWFILATYTAMLEFRKTLAKYTTVEAINRKGN